MSQPPKSPYTNADAPAPDPEVDLGATQALSPIQGGDDAWGMPSEAGWGPPSPAPPPMTPPPAMDYELPPTEPAPFRRAATVMEPPVVGEPPPGDLLAERVEGASVPMAGYGGPPMEESADKRAAMVPTQEGEVTITEQVAEAGKAMAVLSHLSTFLHLPLFLIPLLQKDNPFALYHARQAAVGFLGLIVVYVVLTAITAVTCGVTVFLYALVPIYSIGVSILGALAANDGAIKELPVVGGLAQKLFGPHHYKRI